MNVEHGLLITPQWVLLLAGLFGLVTAVLLSALRTVESARHRPLPVRANVPQCRIGGLPPPRVFRWPGVDHSIARPSRAPPAPDAVTRRRRSPARGPGAR